MTSSGAKTAEFAHLFERLASRRVRSSDLDIPMDDLWSLSIPEELEPVIKSLSTIVGTSKCKTLGSRARISAPDSDSDEESMAKFPLGKKEYPFTFKLMVHKLYRVDEWAKAVKEMLEKSKLEFKPLAEQDAVIEEDKVERERQNNIASMNKDKNAIHFQVGVSNGGRRRGSVVGGRQLCSQTVVFSRLETVGPAFPLIKSPGNGGQSKFRVLKKRRVGRRRLNGRQVTGRKPVLEREKGEWN